MHMQCVVTLGLVPCHSIYNLITRAAAAIDMYMNVNSLSVAITYIVNTGSVEV